MRRKRLALFSLTNKFAAPIFARNLVDMGFGILSTGGTATTLRTAGIDVTDVSVYTGEPERFKGRLKTLHPRIFGPVLAKPNDEDRAVLAEIGWDEIDIVCVNFYAFEEAAAEDGATFDSVVEEIDIGGPSLVRAASKNFKRGAAVMDPILYSPVADMMRRNDGMLTEEARKWLLRDAFRRTAAYDTAISQWLDKQIIGDPFNLA